MSPPLVTIPAPYDGPPVCRDKETWKIAPYCDGCGWVIAFKVWFENKRFCSPGCRPAWHLLAREVCKLPGCDEEIVRTGAKGRPVEFCSEGHHREAIAEDMRRRRRGDPTIDQEVRGDPALRADWMPQIEDMDPDWMDTNLVLDSSGRPISYEVESDWGFGRWLRHGGDWPGMVRGLSRPAVRDGNEKIDGWSGEKNPSPSPVLGSWEPWSEVPDLRC